MEAVWLLWLALVAAVLAIIAPFVPTRADGRANLFHQIQWIAVALAFFFVYLLVNSGALDVNA
jgi:hypothetical protein